MNVDLQALSTSFDLVAPRGGDLMAVFYARLFAVAPAVRPLATTTDLERQKDLLLDVLVLLRRSLDDLPAIAPVLRRLGARHVAYGARPEHYPVVRDVLIAALAGAAWAAWRPYQAAGTPPSASAPAGGGSARALRWMCRAMAWGRGSSVRARSRRRPRCGRAPRPASAAVRCTGRR